MRNFTNQATLSFRNRPLSSNITTGVINEVLNVTKAAVEPQYSTGNDDTFVISLVNTGNTPLTGVTVTDNLGTYQPTEDEPATATPLDYADGTVVSYANGVADPNVTASYADNTLTIENVTVPANGNTVIVYSARPNEFAPLNEGEFIRNTVTVTAPGNTPIEAESTITPVQEADLAISKSLTPQEVTENGNVTYTFTIQNFGNASPTPEDNVIFSDNFEPALENINVTYNGNTWTNGNQFNYDENTGVFETTPDAITVEPATIRADESTGQRTIEPSISTLVISGRLRSTT